MKRRFAAWGAAVVLSLSLLAGCGSGADQGTQSEAQAPAGEASTGQETVYPLTVTDSVGRKVTIAAEPQRVVSIAPSTTELVYAVGRGDVLVGRSDYDDYPPEAQQVDSVGSYFPPNYERILSKEPDLVLMESSTEDAVDKLTQEYGLTVFVIKPNNVSEVSDTIRTLGKILNAQEKANQVAADMEQQVNAIAEKAATAESKPKVFYEVWDDPLMSAGKNTFIDELIRLAGGENVAAAAGLEDWSQISLEQVVAADPDIIVAGSHGISPDEVMARPGWGEIKAVKEQQVFAIEDEDLLTIPSPRLVQGLEWMAETIHPEIFSK